MIKAFTSEIEEKSDSEKSVVAKISTSDVDRYGDVVVPQGMDAKNYEKNPVVLLNHASYGLPVGRSAWLKVQANDVKSKTIFADTTLGNDVYTLASGGFMNARSIGFMVKAEEPGGPKDKFRRKITGWELYEYSIVTIPANPNAVKSMVDMCESLEMKSLFDDYRKDAELVNETEELKRIILEKDACIAEIKERFESIAAKTNEQKINNRLETLATPNIHLKIMNQGLVAMLDRMNK